ncbi:MAG: transcriptional regulator [Candidatus Diapherotrites archaeon]|nr:transcriptional regulator [Candidatus Diapherotrites archaeon]
MRCFKIAEEHEALQLDTRSRLYNEIRKSPGLHFRELQRRVNMATGALQYHLDYLGKKSLIKSERVENTKRFFVMQSKRIEGEEQIMPFLRQEKTRHILMAMLSGRKNTIQSLARKTQTPYSTTSRLLDKIVRAGVSQKTRKSKQIHYILEKPENITEMLITYRKSFLDDLVDEFVATVQELKT